MPTTYSLYPLLVIKLPGDFWSKKSSRPTGRRHVKTTTTIKQLFRNSLMHQIHSSDLKYEHQRPNITKVMTSKVPAQNFLMSPSKLEMSFYPSALILNLI